MRRWEEMYICRYETKEGYSDISMASDGEYLTALIFEGTKDAARIYGEEKEVPVFSETKRWLDIYFSGRDPGFLPKMKLDGLSEFRAVVTKLMLAVPFGKSTSYGEIAKEAARLLGKERMSAQAAGGAVGSNPICIIIPCHRVLGADGRLTGYGGGIENKKALLENEGIAFRE